jgi:subtilase family serine protease
VAADRVLSRIAVRFSLTVEQSRALEQLLQDQQNPASPQYRRWLTPEQYGARFGPDPGLVASLSAWLQAQGLVVTEVARGGSYLALSGTAEQVQRAFGVVLHTVSVDGEPHLANLNEVSLPAEFASRVAGVTGLDDFRLKPHVRVHPEYTSSITGSHYVAPGDLYTIYDVNPLLSSSINGAGVTIAVLGQTDISLADVAAFRAASGLTANVPTVKLYSADPGVSTADIDEAQLDVEWAGAVAPAATILYVNSTSVIAGSLTAAVVNNLAPIISLSYGACESGFGPANLAVYNQLLRQANAQGQTVVASAGDSGATDCDFQANSASAGLAVDFPASSPFATGVGGTMFAEGSGTYWSAGNGSYAGSALSYIPETVWNETAAVGTLAAGGGGASFYFTKPPFQVGTGVPNDYSRDVPDVALNAGTSHDGYLFCSQGWCTNGFRNAGSLLDVAGGTSVATPVFAGILALVEQKIHASVGNANPVLYGLAGSCYGAAIFHDVTSGNNLTPCTTGSANCPGGGAIGYTAGTGYDLASGWGSVDVAKLAADWLLASPTGLGSTIGQGVSTTTLTDGAASVTAGATVVLVASVGPNAPSPTGTVQFLVDNVPTGSAVTLAGSIATYSLSTTGLASGTHMLTAAYSGDTNYSGSKGALNLTVVVPTTGDFTLTPSTASTTVAAGGTAPGITFTVSSVNSFAGNVTFTSSSSTASLPASYSFNIDPVALTSGGSGTTVLTMLAYIPGAQTTHGLVRAPASGVSRVIPGWKAIVPVISVAGILLFAVPRRRRIGALMAAAICAGALASAGCSSQPAASSSTPVVVKTPPGTYNILVTATGTNATGTVVTHNAAVTFVVN